MKFSSFYATKCVLSDMFWFITRNLNVRSNCDSDPTCNNISEFRMLLNFDGEELD